MAVNIQGIIQNALSDFSGTMAQKESRMNLAQQRRATTQREDTNNFLVTSGVVGLDENGNFNVDLEKAHMQGGDRFINLLNEEAKAGRKFTDVNTGETVTGKFEDLPSAVKVGEGDNAATNYILTITTPDGRKVPVTTGRSNDPSDGPAVLDQSSLELIYESAILNSIGKYGISGTAAGMLDNMNFNNSQAKAQLQAADALQNEENSQALVSLIGSLGPNLKSINPNRGTTKSGLPEVPLDSTPEGTTKPVTTTEEGTIKGTSDQFYVLDTSQKEVQDALPLINNIQAGQSYSAEEIDQLSKGLSPGFRSAFKKNFSFNSRLLEVNAEKIAELEAKEDKSPKEERELAKLQRRRESYLIPQQQKQIDRVRKNIADDTAAQQAADAKATEKVKKQIATKEALLNNPKLNLSEGRRKEIQAEVDELKGGMTQQDTGENVSFELPEIPTDAEGAAKWFSDPANQATIDQLDQEKVTEVRQLLQKFNINSKEELIDGVKTGKISQNAFRNAAKLISWSIVDKNGQKDPQLSANLYAGMINEALTGSPGVTSTQMANAQTARDRLQFEMKKYYDGLTDEKYSGLKSLYDLGAKGFDSPEFIQKLKAETTLFLKDKRFEDLTTTDKELMDGILSQALLEAANKSGSDSVADWFGDVFLRGSAGDTLGNTMDNVAIEYDKDPNTNADARPVRLIFTRSRGGSQVEADQSLDWNDVTEIIGQGELTNYLLSRAKRR